jgi:hypothetical protein
MVFAVGVSVVSTAEQDAVVDGGFSAVGPVTLVVDVAPGGGDIAVPVLAVPVSGDDRAAFRSGERAGGTAGVEDLAVRSRDDPGDRAVAAEHLGGLTDDHGPEPERRGGSTLSLGEGGVVDDHGDVRCDAAGVGQLAGREGGATGGRRRGSRS